MKNLRKLLLAPIFGAAIALVTPAPATAASGGLTFQGVTFWMMSTANTIQLWISGASGATDDWSGVQYLNAVALGGLTGATLTSVSANFGSWSVNSGGLNANAGCSGSGGSYSCIQQTGTLQGFPTTPNDTMNFTFTFAGSNLDLSYPTLKVQFLTGSGDAKATGNLLSLPIPEPEIYAMLAIGLGVLGWSARRRKSKDVAAG